MTSVDKLLIQGIRSYGTHEEPAVIKFSKPLTLIVGRNGSGKTTIIECLRYSLTGEHPPGTSKGQSFVHDPTILGLPEVKANVALQFSDVRGHTVTISHVLHAQMVKGKLKKSQQDVSIQKTVVDDDGRKHKQSRSMKPTEFIRNVPGMIGVSKAVLDNVIFVHQEESNWPLSEPAILKKKFDDIFAATRYAKAMEQMMKIRKEQTGDLKVFGAQLETLKTIKGTAEDIKESMKQDVIRVDKLEEEIQKCLSEEEALEKEVQKKEDLLEKVSQKEEKIRMTTVLLSQTAERKEQLKASIAGRELSDETEALEELRGKSKHLVETTMSDLKELEQNALRAEKTIADMKEDHFDKIMALSRLQAEIEAQEGRKKERDAFCVEIAESCGMPTLSLPLTKESENQLRLTLQQNVSAVKDRIDDHRDKKDESSVVITKSIEDLGEQIVAGSGKMSNNKELLAVAHEGLADLEKRTKALSVDESKFATLLPELKEKDADARKNVEEAMKKAAALEATHDQDKDDISRKLKELQEQLSGASSNPRLGFLRNMHDEKNMKIRSLRGSLRTRFEAMGQLSINVNQDDPDTVSSKLEQLEDTLKCEREVVASEVLQSELSLAKMIEDISNTESQIKSIDGIASTCRDVSALKNRIGSIEGELEEERGDYYASSKIMKMYEMYAKTAEKHRKCVVCKRKFESEGEAATFSGIQRGKIPEVEFKVEEHQDKIKELESELASLKDEIKTDDAVLENKRKLSSLKEELLSHEKNKSQEEEKLAAAKGRLSALNSKLEDINDLKGGDLRELVAAITELNATKEEIDGIEKASSLASESAGKTMEEITADIARLSAQRDSIIQVHLDAQNALQRARDKSEIAKKEYDCLVEAKNEADKIRSEREELSSRIVTLDNEIESQRKSIEDMEKEKYELSAKRAMEQEAAQRISVTLEENYRLAQRNLDRFMTFDNAIQKSEQEGVGDQFKHLKNQVDAIKTDLRAKDDLLKQMRKSIEDKRATVNNQNEWDRRVEDNIAYRRIIVEESEHNASLEEAENAIAAIGDPDELNEALSAMQRDLSATLEKKLQMQGALKTYDTAAREKANKLREEQFLDIEKLFQAQLLQQKLTQMASADLDQYSSALEKALQTFHSDKMREINHIIKELWQKVYQGSDIDYIQIKTDADSNSRSSRAYNYRVVMRTGEAELDLRGRCSAGQKVLACLIIRLALSETFCISCGMLALDEPSTNLDRANSRSLALALAEIMQSRSQQRNFQLLVITHDESFAQAIGQREFCETYWRVDKNAEGYSQIKEQDLLE